ncbi:hypothetical protein V8C86DRAFT_2987035 [Haematococcus lacustris]
MLPAAEGDTEWRWGVGVAVVVGGQHMLLLLLPPTAHAAWYCCCSAWMRARAGGWRQVVEAARGRLASPFLHPLLLLLPWWSKRAGQALPWLVLRRTLRPPLALLLLLLLLLVGRSSPPPPSPTAALPW